MPSPFWSGCWSGVRQSRLSLLLGVMLVWLPPSMATAQPSPATTPTDSFISTTLKPLLTEALTQSTALEQTLIASEERLVESERQRKINFEERLKEQAASEKALTALDNKLTLLQTYSNSLWTKLNAFSGSEDERQSRALREVDGLIRSATTLEREAAFWKVVGLVGGLLGAGALTYALLK